MKYIILPFILTLVLLYSCSNDTTTPTSANHTADTVSLFTKDSLYVNQNILSGTDSCTYFCTTTIDTIHVSFEMFTYGVLYGSCDFNINYINKYHKAVTSNIDIQQNVAFPITQTNFNNSLIINASSTQLTYLLSLKNIKIWYIKRT